MNNIFLPLTYYLVAFQQILIIWPVSMLKIGNYTRVRLLRKVFIVKILPFSPFHTPGLGQSLHCMYCTLEAMTRLGQGLIRLQDQIIWKPTESCRRSIFTAEEETWWYLPFLLLQSGLGMFSENVCVLVSHPFLKHHYTVCYIHNTAIHFFFMEPNVKVLMWQPPSWPTHWGLTSRANSMSCYSLS